MMKKATQEEEAVAVTNVFWDINTCPVPDGCDPHLVRPCIKRLLEKNGYRGPFTVTAFGKLADVPIDMLRGVFSSGIDLILVPFGTSDIIEIIDITESNPPPVNFMVISDPMACPDLTLFLKSMSYNPLQPFPYHLSMETLLGEGGVPAETTDSVSWECLVCCAPDPPGRSFDTFEAHLSSEEHHEEVLLMQTRGPTVQPVLTPLVHSLDKINLGDLHLSRLVEAPLLAQCGDNMVEWETVKAEGRTVVFWDINSCPVPPDCDASMVGPCIKRFLKKEGCSGPLSIIAIGDLTDFHPGTLSEVFSSGITLHNVPYGPSDIEKLIYDFSSCSGPPINIMVISNCKNFACMSDFIQRRFNLLKPFPNDSLERLILADSGYLKDNCSGYLWFCSLCNDRKFVHATTYLSSFHGSFEPVSSFERFIWHLHGSIHRWKMLELCPLNEQLLRMSEPLSVPREKNLKAVTSVYWDIKSCPVPHGCDPRRIGRCIKQFLENKGYSGPLTITSIGSLSDIANDILEGGYSSGISLYNIYDGFLNNLKVLISEFTSENSPPANIMVISNPNFLATEKASFLGKRGYNLVPCDSCEFLADSEALEEDDKYSDETSESAFWICSICDNLWGQGFENFTTHVASRRHQRRLLNY